MKILDSLRFKATHIAKSLKKPSARPKLVKECVFPNAQGTTKLIANLLKMNKGQLVTTGHAQLPRGGVANVNSLG